MSTTRRRRNLVRNFIPKASSLSFLWNSKKKLALLFAIFGVGGYQMPNIMGWVQQFLNNGQAQVSQYNPYGNNGGAGGGLLEDLKGEITNALNKGAGSYAPQNTPVGYQRGNPPPPVNVGETIHVCSFNIQVFGEKKLENRDVVNVLAQVARNFDIVAIQEIRSVRDDILPRFLQEINATGRRFDFIIGPRMGRTVSKEQYAFIFDTARIEVDRRSAYAVGDPTSRMQRAPFVAHFRVRGPDPRQAFTFKLVNVNNG